MAKDGLEEYINNNRDAFDDKTPSDKVWHKINRRLSPGKKVIWWKIAAIFFFATTVGLTYNDYQKEPVSQNELSELESFYFEQIDYKQTLLKNHQHIGATGMGLEQDLQKMDAMYKVLKEEWQKKPSKEVLEALTLNLIVRIDLLNRQLQLMEEPESDDEKSAGRNI